ncbi:MAG TPA: hypothetical protein ENF38_00765 [Candidatus Aenigmarchaeota archaeon]|nr:hypothetical protein [Candidatus Aenigmarchaeota archaeon]
MVKVRKYKDWELKHLLLVVKAFGNEEDEVKEVVFEIGKENPNFGYFPISGAVALNPGQIKRLIKFLKNWVAKE